MFDDIKCYWASGGLGTCVFTLGTEQQQSNSEGQAGRTTYVDTSDPAVLLQGTVPAECQRCALKTNTRTASTACDSSGWGRAGQPSLRKYMDNYVHVHKTKKEIHDQRLLRRWIYLLQILTSIVRVIINIIFIYEIYIFLSISYCQMGTCYKH